MHQPTALDSAPWQKSSYCSENGCVEVAQVGDSYAVRDRKNPQTAVLVFDRAEWKAFINGVKAGEFDYDTN